MDETVVVVIGAGPAGLTAAYQLAKAGVPVTVLEADPVYVGGLARTVQYQGFRFDIGGHRFFSKSQEIEDLWTEILPHDLLVRRRSSRIYYRGKFFSYPLRTGDALWKLGVVEAARCILSYLRARMSPVRDPRTFEEWVSNQFGRRLFTIFFKTYTEKVWGMNCREISADWAAQRIKGFSLWTAVRNALWPECETRDRGRTIKTLIGSFRYPRLGPGMLWEACADKVHSLGGVIELGRRVVECSYEAGNKTWIIRHQDAQRNVRVTRAEHLLSSAPLRELAHSLSPRLSDTALAAAEALRYRDFLTVALIVRDRGHFDDNWVYVHDPGVKVGRVQNYKSWSPDMVPEPSMTCYGLEYFCFEGDGLWDSADEALIDLASKELARIGLAALEDVQDGCVVRQRKAYPVYNDGYAANITILRRELAERFPTLHLVGRNGMHKYDNQDHAMMTALLCVRNIMAGKRLYDPWQINQDAEYIEEEAKKEGGASGLRLVPAQVRVAADFPQRSVLTK